MSALQNPFVKIHPVEKSPFYRFVQQRLKQAAVQSLPVVGVLLLKGLN